MTTKLLRKIIKIDEELCDGCGLCVPGCVEGALQIVDGKAKLISEIYCDGLGACLGECPQGAITIEEREAEGFDEEATELYMEQAEQTTDPLPDGCPGSAVRQFEKPAAADVTAGALHTPQSKLSQWPIQLTLVPPSAPFLQGADLMLAADCVPFACAGFHRELLGEHALLVACPKLDGHQDHLKKLADILRLSQPKSLTVVHMEVPCCFGLVQMARQAIDLSGRDIPFNDITVGVRGELQS